MIATECTIYALKDPDSKEVMYVGRTIRPLNRRLDGHISGRSTNPKKEWILGLASRGMKPIIEELEIVDISIANKKELYWIEYYQNKGSNLWNVNLPLNVKYSPKWNKRLIKEQLEQLVINKIEDRKVSIPISKKNTKTKYVLSESRIIESKKQLGEIITNYINKKQVTQTTIQKYTGIQHVSLKAMKSGEGAYTIDNLLKLLNFLGLELVIKEKAKEYAKIIL